MKKKQLIEFLKRLMHIHCSEDNTSHDNRYYTKQELNNIISHPPEMSYIGKPNYIAYPEDGSLHLSGSDDTTDHRIGKYEGYLKITLPVLWTNTMISFTVTIFDLNNDHSVTYHISGYNYLAGLNWLCTTAVCVGKKDAPLSNLPVRFGCDDDRKKSAICIGEVNTVWTYPQVQIHDIVLGYLNTESSMWKSGWNIEIVKLALSKIHRTITNTHVSL